MGIKTDIENLWDSKIDNNNLNLIAETIIKDNKVANFKTKDTEIIITMEKSIIKLRMK